MRSIGETVYIYEKWGQTICSGKVLKIYESSTEEVAYDVHLNGPVYGTQTVFDADCFSNEEDLKKEIERRRAQRIKDLKVEITDINSLCVFMLTHTVSPCEEYTDWEARTAVIERAKELGLDLNLSD